MKKRPIYSLANAYRHWRGWRRKVYGNPPTTHTIPATKPTKKAGAGLVGTRADLHRLMMVTVGNPYGWTYNFVRPLNLPGRRLTVAELAHLKPLRKALTVLVKAYRSDCSWGVKTLFYLAGCKDDPTGCDWTGWGNSTSTYKHLAKRAGLDNATGTSQQLARFLSACKVGDILLVGENGSDHMTLIMEAAPDPLLWSDGHEGAPNSYRVSDDPRRPISVCVPSGFK